MKYNPDQSVEVFTLQKKAELFSAPASNFKVPSMENVNSRTILPNSTNETNGQKALTNSTKLNTQNSTNSLPQKTIRKKLQAKSVKKPSDRLRALAPKPLPNNKDLASIKATTSNNHDTSTNKTNEAAEVVIISTSTDSSHESSAEKQVNSEENTRKRKKRSSSLGKNNNGSEKTLKTSNSNSQINLNVGKDVRISNEKIIENFFENCSKYVDDKLESLNKFFNTNLISGSKSKAKVAKTNVNSNLDKFNSLKLQTKIHKLHNNHLNKLNRLNDLIDLNSIHLKQVKKNNNLDPNSSRPNKSASFSNEDKLNNKSLTKSTNLIEINSVDSEKNKLESVPFKDENNVNSSQSELLDLTNEDTDTPCLKRPNAVTTVNSNNLPIIPLLTIESEQREKGPAVILTWKIKHLITQQILEENDHEKFDIDEYQLYGYREQSGQTNSNWNYVRNII